MFYWKKRVNYFILMWYELYYIFECIIHIVYWCLKGMSKDFKGMNPDVEDKKMISSCKDAFQHVYQIHILFYYTVCPCRNN